jgi:hypothetical protein
MTFAELVAEVYTLTNRPDLVAETKTAVRVATLKAHQSDFYSKDIHETGVVFPASAYIQSLDYISLISNFRALKYFRRVVNANDTSGVPFSVLTPDELIDSYNIPKVNVAYVAGRVIEFRSAVSFQFGLMGCYVNPIVREGAYASWVAEQHPYVIVFEAARVVFKAIGYDEQSASFERLVAEQFALLRMSALSDVGY